MIEQIKVKSSIGKVAKIIPFAIKTNLIQSGNDCIIEFNNTDINRDTKEMAKECLLRYLKFNNIKVIQENNKIKMDTENINNKKILIVDNIIKRIQEDFIIDDEFDLLELINNYGLNFILNDLSLFIKDNYKK